MNEKYKKTKTICLFKMFNRRILSDNEHMSFTIRAKIVEALSKKENVILDFSDIDEISLGILLESYGEMITRNGIFYIDERITIIGVSNDNIKKFIETTRTYSQNAFLDKKREEDKNKKKIKL